MVLMVGLMGCEGYDYELTVIDVDPDEVVLDDVILEPVDEVKKYITAGQSNVGKCDWAYFEDLTGSEVVSVHLSGAGIDELITDTDYSKIEGLNARAILFVHGETDSYRGTSREYYIDKVKQYKELLGGSDLYISAVGFHANKKHEESFTNIRNSTINESKINEGWFMSFEDAKYFRSWGMLIDNLHFSSDGCMMMMDAFAEQVYKEE